jgi:hypothetical protein
MTVVGKKLTTRLDIVFESIVSRFTNVLALSTLNK